MDRASRTAQLAALARASLNRDPPPFHFDDPLARRFLVVPFSLMARALFIARPLLQRRMPGTYSFMLARSRFFERALLDALEEGATQVVLLGAGFDTRPYRLTYPSGVTVFEVDAPQTSELKRAQVCRLFGALPRHVTYVSIDFGRQSLAERLSAAGYDARRLSFFLWEGVTFYLPEAAVAEVLAFVSTQSAPGSTVAFDHLYDDVPTGESLRFGARAAAAFVRKQGEPFIWGLPEGGEEQFLARFALTCEERLGPAEMQKMLEAGGRAPKEAVAGMYGLLRARVGNCWLRPRAALDLRTANDTGCTLQGTSSTACNSAASAP